MKMSESYKEGKRVSLFGGVVFTVGSLAIVAMFVAAGSLSKRGFDATIISMIIFFSLIAVIIASVFVFDYRDYKKSQKEAEEDEAKFERDWAEHQARHHANQQQARNAP